MNTALLLKNIATHISLSHEEEAYFISFLQYRKIKKKQFLYQEGDVNKFQAFVVEGCLRSYSVDRNGFEHILQFAPPGWWIGDMRSIIAQEPGILYIDAVDDSGIILLLKTDLEKIYTTIPKFERFFRILAENALAAYQHRLIGNLSLSAKERYENFCRLYPSLIQCLPQKQVAAYIGVTPEFLSKMLNRSASER
ncbi:Crp/Fnr family transcriptional regulator [Agriterribacter sp.]|uniref:Crp/Fnr family transcriptional regulator n=1 Tax=Agriterribacter sp. TaxID=2821509 RepID=UPI002C7DF6E5|nr:Crp/Fnr family transcriptional regulator [Agriterribacter sp.]HRO44959.1 Crp/Fnr family transcriptional regulator [Agriterribacter sp.]HRQ15697.1 Crp/Fnr family transcriptional regulator [Agriterribacter sp.]